jgi:hypothetical protein
VNFHTKLVGAFDAIILSLSAALTIVMLFVLFNPAADGGRMAAAQKEQQVLISRSVIAPAANRG